MCPAWVKFSSLAWGCWVGRRKCWVGVGGDDEAACLFRMYPDPCGSWLASDGGLTADLSFAGVHIRFCGNGH